MIDDLQSTAMHDPQTVSGLQWLARDQSLSACTVSMSRRRSGSRSNRCRANAGAVVTSKSPKIVEIDLLVRFRENVGHSARWRQQRPGVSLDVNPAIACTVRSSPWPRTCPTIPRGCLSAALKRRIEPRRLNLPKVTISMEIRKLLSAAPRRASAGLFLSHRVRTIRKRSPPLSGCAAREAKDGRRPVHLALGCRHPHAAFNEEKSSPQGVQNDQDARKVADQHGDQP